MSSLTIESLTKESLTKESLTKKSLIKEILNEFNAEALIEKNEIYDLVKHLSHNLIAKYYHQNIEPFKYCRSEASGWYEYNQFNILEHKGNNPPPSLLNNLSNTFQEIFINERNQIQLPIPTGDKAEDDKQRKFIYFKSKII